jgi:pyruvate kinase
MSLPPIKTKIVCTIGPASDNLEVLKEMIAAGMNVARINFAHGDFSSHRETIGLVREAAAAVGRPVAIMGDLPGPKMRIGRLKEEPIQLHSGQSFILQTEPILGDGERVSMSFEKLSQAVRPGDKIFINDGFVQLEVVKLLDQEVHCRVVVGGELRSNKGVNFPGIDLGINAFTERDEECLAFAAEMGLDAISQSFVQGPEDITAVRQAAGRLDFRPFIIAKLERASAVDNLDAILQVADGIMVARGDLGVEIPIEEIALVQKQMITRAKLYGAPVITATHMLESMIENSRPTRAEATDVANAILDGTDCVMLSGETAVGQRPAASVTMMTRIASVTEPKVVPREVLDVLEAARAAERINPEDLISLAVHFSVEAVRPVAIFTPTMSGATARRVSRFRLPVWIIAISANPATCQSLLFSYGVFPVLELERPENWEQYARDWLERQHLEGKMALLTQGTATHQAGYTNQLAILDLSRPAGNDAVW